MKRRNLIALLALAPLAACVVNLSFDIDKQLTLASQQAGAISQTQTVNLSDYAAIRDHKGNIKSLDLDSADVTVLTVLSGNTSTTVSGTLVLRPGGVTDASQDVQVGTLTNFSTTQGSTVKLPGTPQLDAFLLAQVQAAGTFSAILNGTVNGVTNLVIDVDLHASLGYDSGLF
jgi:hypothetical protein